MKPSIHRTSPSWRTVGPAAFLATIILASPLSAAESYPAPGSKLPPAGPDKTITTADATAERVGISIPSSAIGEPVGAVTLSPPRWVDAANGRPAHVLVDGAIAAVDPNCPPINFRVALPATWNRRSIQLGGGGMNGMIPNLTGSHLGNGYVTYGSDSGHQAAFGRNASPNANAWALNDEAIRNLGYLQMKKTHDAAMVIVERVYGEQPRFNYYVGGSQGGREGLTVAQRYPADYDGVVANVPIVNFSTLMLAPELIRIQEKPLANWVTPAKVNAIRQEFLRQADKLDGLADGIINNYMAARALFDVSDGPPDRNPWAALRAPDGVDPDPEDASVNARLSDGQIATLKLVYSRYQFATPLANGVKSFGMWVPNTDPGGSGLIERRRYRGQEGATPDAPTHGHLGVLGVTGFLMRDLSANPLDYVEGGPLNARRVQLSEWLDSTNPDLSAFYRRGGKLIVTIGTADTLASPGAQLDYFQSVLDTMGRDQVDAFARLFVIPQANHGLGGSSHGTNGDGETIPVVRLPNQIDQLALLTAWVERNEAPAKTLVVTAGDRSLPLCSYPNYPKYIGGPPEAATSYVSAAP